MYWGFGEKKEKRGRLATDVSSGAIFLTKKKKEIALKEKKRNLWGGKKRKMNVLVSFIRR